MAKFKEAVGRSHRVERFSLYLEPIVVSKVSSTFLFALKLNPEFNHPFGKSVCKMINVDELLRVALHEHRYSSVTST